ncbi:MAG: phosphodiesterase [Halopseudomonas sp.]|uniref:phosphodiesterase n=1 Tax=Halopseudomonas sp. TaxID=2901191 RepID=UPI0030025E45
MIRPLLLTSVLFSPALLQADTLAIPVGEQTSSSTPTSSLPQRGASQDTVARGWGEPVKRHAAVGQPPITRWDYNGFSVYFEYSHVIDSVRQHTPKAP